MTFLEREYQRDPQRRWVVGPWIERPERVVVDPEAFPMSWGNGRFPAWIDLGDHPIFRSGLDVEGTRDRGPGYTGRVSSADPPTQDDPTKNSSEQSSSDTVSASDASE